MPLLLLCKAGIYWRDSAQTFCSTDEFVVSMMVAGDWAYVLRQPLTRVQFEKVEVLTGASWLAAQAALRNLLMSPLLETVH